MKTVVWTAYWWWCVSVCAADLLLSPTTTTSSSLTASVNELYETVRATHDPEDGCELPTQFCSNLMDRYEHYACVIVNATTTSMSEGGREREWRDAEGRLYRLRSEHAYQPALGPDAATHRYVTRVELETRDDGVQRRREDNNEEVLASKEPALFALLPYENGTVYACHAEPRLHAVEPCLFSHHPSLESALQAYDEYLACVERSTQRVSMWVQVMGLAALIVGCAAAVVYVFLLSYNLFGMCFDCIVASLH